MKGKTIDFSGKLNLWKGAHASWHLVSLPTDASAKLRKKYKGLHKGWNSLKVEVKIGKSTWTTSIFYDTKSGRYILPVKQAIRKAEVLYEDDTLDLKLKLI